MNDVAKRAALLALMTDFVNEHPEMSAEELAEYENMEKEYDALDKKIKRLEALARKEKYLNGTDEQHFEGEGGGQDETNEYTNNFLAYARTGDKAEFLNVLSTQVAEDGGYLVPEEWATKIIKNLRSRTHVRKYATVIKTGGTYNMPTAGAKPVFGWVDELGKYPKHDVKFGNKTLEAHKSGGIILVSEELLEDENFNLEEHLQELTEEALDIVEGTAFLVGDGVKKPKGITKSILAENTLETAVTDTIALTDVENLFLQPKAGYRKNATWIISEKFFKAIFRMKDADGNRIWSQGFDSNEQGRIFNRPYEIDDTLLAEAGEPLAIFGDISKYKIADRGSIGLKRIGGYEEDGMVGFKVYKRVDGKLTIDEAIAMLNNKA